MKQIFLLLTLLTLSYAEFVTSFDDVPPASETVLGTPVGDDNTVQTQTVTVQPSSDQILGEEITAEPVQEVYKEVRVEDLMGYGTLKIALLVPKNVIKGYAKRVSNSILSYLIFKNEDFTYEVFNSGDESDDNLINTLNRIKAKGYKFVIAPLTPDGARIVSAYEKDMLIYIPTLNSHLFQKQGNIYYGGIDYKKQIDKLMDYTNGKIAVFSGRSWLAQELTGYIQEQNYDIYIKTIKNPRINPKYVVKNNYHLQNASVFFNMPLVSSALLASSFTSYGIKPYRLLSTQINYSPLLFTMIQRKDRQNFYLANSIGYVNSKLNDINQNFGIKIKYDWVAYSSSIGIDHIFSKYYGLEETFNEELINHQVRYRTKVYKIKDDEFVRAK